MKRLSETGGVVIGEARRDDGDLSREQYAIILHSSRICLDSTAERKEKIDQNLWLTDDL